MYINQYSHHKKLKQENNQTDSLIVKITENFERIITRKGSTLGVEGVLPEPRFSGKLRLPELRGSSLKATSKDVIKLEGRLICQYKAKRREYNKPNG